MIKNAKDTLLTENPGTLPDLSGAFRNWLQPMKFITIAKAVGTNFKVQETPTEVDFMGCLQTMRPEQIQKKPEGQRSWHWYSLIAEPSLILAVDDRVQYLGRKYRVDNKSDYSLNGFVSYDLIEDFDDSP